MNVIALHGGAGDRQRESTNADKERELIECIDEALSYAYAILKGGGSSIDAVERAIMSMEEFPCFNAGVGAAINEHGVAELDAGIMDGKTSKAGAVACVTQIRRPIQAARMVMEKTDRVLFVGSGAEDLAWRFGMEQVSNSHFITIENLDKFHEMQDQIIARTQAKSVTLGTVGAVALDSRANMCAGNSTGGMMMKPAGRVGDTPIVGAGMYARNGVAAIASTGYGEYFIRTSAAHEVASLLRYAHRDLSSAVSDVLAEISQLGGRGGMIAIDNAGNVSMQHTTTSMVRAAITKSGEKIIEIW